MIKAIATTIIIMLIISFFYLYLTNSDYQATVNYELGHGIAEINEISASLYANYQNINASQTSQNVRNANIAAALTSQPKSSQPKS
jgi:hypothetical protein